MKRAILGLAIVGLALFAAGVIGLRPDQGHATLLPSGIHWAHSGGPARIGVIVEAGDGINLDRQLIANVVAEYDKLDDIEIGVVAQTISPEECADRNAPSPYGYIIVCRWEFGSGGEKGWYDCPTYIPGCDITAPRHQGGARVDLPAPNYPYYPNMICHELGHALGLDEGGDGCMNSYPWAERNKGYCPGATDMAELTALYDHDDGFTPTYTVAPFVEVGQDYGCPLPPFYDDGSGQQYTPTPTSTGVSTATPTPTDTPTPVPATPTRTPCVPPNAKRCRP